MRHINVKEFQEKADKRLAICNACDKKVTSKVLNKDVDKCGVCGCVLFVITKVKSSCPNNHW